MYVVPNKSSLCVYAILNFVSQQKIWRRNSRLLTTAYAYAYSRELPLSPELCRPKEEKDPKIEHRKSPPSCLITASVNIGASYVLFLQRDDARKSSKPDKHCDSYSNSKLFHRRQYADWQKIFPIQTIPASWSSNDRHAESSIPSLHPTWNVLHRGHIK